MDWNKIPLDSFQISCEPVEEVEGHYSNYSDKKRNNNF
jgi:hypothetical protein